MLSCIMPIELTSFYREARRFGRLFPLFQDLILFNFSLQRLLKSIHAIVPSIYAFANGYSLFDALFVIRNV